MSWFADDDPSPRVPTCTVLWKEFLRLKKQRPPSPSSPVDLCYKDDERGDDGGSCKREKHVMRMKKGLERTRSASGACTSLHTRKEQSHDSLVRFEERLDSTK